MLTLTKQELFKLMKKRSTWITTIIMLISQIVIAVWAKNSPKLFDAKSMFLSQFFASYWYVFFLIAAAATIITMEFQYGTIKQVLYRKYYRGEVLVSKWLTVFLYSIYWVALSWIMSLLLWAVLFADKIDLSSKISPGVSLLRGSVESTGSSLLTLWLLLSMVFLLANIFKSSAVAVSVGIVGYFVTSFLNSFLVLLIQKWEWVKWNPLTMLLYPNVILDDSYAKMAKLTATQLFCGNVVWIVIFLGLGYWVFKKRSV